MGIGISTPLYLTAEEQCGKVVNAIKKSGGDFNPLCNSNKVYKNCRRTFTFSDKPFILSNATRSSFGSILYLLGPQELTAAANYPAIIYVPKNAKKYIGSKKHSSTFIVGDHVGSCRLEGGDKMVKKNTVIMNITAYQVIANLNKGHITVKESKSLESGIITLLHIYNYVSHSTTKQHIITDCKTRYVDAGKNGVYNTVRSHDVDCQDKDYEVRKVNEKDIHSRSTKQTIFIINESSGIGATIGSGNLESKKSLDVILFENTDIGLLRVNEHQANYNLELLAYDKRSTVAGIKIDSFEKLVIQVKRAEIAVQSKSLLNIIKDMKYQRLNYLGGDVDSKIMEDSKKRSKAVVFANITDLNDSTSYKVAKDIINNNDLGIPISLVQVKKIVGDVVYETVVENIYSDEVVADFSHENISYKKIITVEMKPDGSKCVVKLPQAHEYDRPVDFTLRVINSLAPYASISKKIIDLTEYDINPEDVECRTDGKYAVGIILNSYVNQGSFQVILDNYLRNPRYQHIVFQFNKSGEFYKVNSTNLKFEPLLYNYEKKAMVDYSSFRYYKPDERGLKIYHNQPEDENKVGFIDLKDRSIFDFNMKVIYSSFVLLHNNATFIEMKNWGIYQHAREVMFAFGDAIVSNLKCIASTCNLKDVIEEFNKEKEHLNLSKELLHAARDSDFNKVKDFIARGADVNIKDDNNWTPFYFAVQWTVQSSSDPYLDLVKFFIDKKADVNAKDNENSTPLHVAIQCATQSNSDSVLGLVKLLIDTGVDVDARDNDGYIPLYFAIQCAVKSNSCLSLVKLLIDAGADVNARDNDGQVLLHWAVRLASLGAVKLLVEGGAEIDSKDNQGYTSLHWAVRLASLDMVKFLVEKGANVDTKCNDGKTPLDIARDIGCNSIVEYLEEKLKGERPIQCKRRHHHGDHYHDRYHSHLSRQLLAADLSNQPKIATSSAAKPSSWMNIVANTIVDAIKGIAEFVYSPLKAELPTISENGSDHSDTARNPSNQYTNQFSSEVCVSNNVGLAFFLLQSFLDKKYPLPKLCSITPEEALASTLNITGKLEEILRTTAKQFDVLVKDVDFFKIHLDIAGHVRNERYSQIQNTLYSAAKEACPKNEKFLSILKGNIEKMFNEQQIVNSGYQVQIPNDIADNKPRSYLNNMTVDKQLQNAIYS